MHFPSFTTIATGLALVSRGSAYVLDIYQGSGCEGTPTSVNVWDNTCATWQGGFNSFTVSAFGGSHQKAYFFVPGNCGDLLTAQWVVWADGGDAEFQQGICYGKDGVFINALASYSS